jgi:uncharacterized protein YjdB
MSHALPASRIRRAMPLLLLGPLACGSDGESPSPIVSVTAVKLTPQSIQLTGVGDTTRLVVQITPANATDKAISWESTDSGVAVVSPAGLVTSVAAGSGVLLTVFTHDGGHQASTTVTVNP